MLNAGAQPHGVMQGKGSYNKHAKLPAGGAALAMPLLEKAVQNVELDTTDQTIVTTRCPGWLIPQPSAQPAQAGPWVEAELVQ